VKYFVPILFFLSLCSCTVGPRPLMVGKDVCDFCKMPVADAKFGGEIITVKGKLYKFDDLGCMIHFRKNGLGTNETIHKIFPINYLNCQKFIDVNQSVFLISENFRTPMNSGIAAFVSQQEATPFLKDFPGEILTWDQLQQKSK
jgi:copper chaperone NosL